LSVSESLPAPTNQTGFPWASPFRAPPQFCKGQNKRRKNIGTEPVSLTKIQGWRNRLTVIVEIPVRAEKRQRSIARGPFPITDTECDPGCTPG
jgi:hypothetical protein